MKRVLCIIFALLIASLALASCDNGGVRFDPLDSGKVKLVTASDAIYSSYMYMIEDEGALAELTELYNSMSYDAKPDGAAASADLLADKLYFLSYHYEEAVDGVIPAAAATLWLSPKGYVLIEDEENSTMQAHKLTSSFDAEHLEDLLAKYDTTPDISIIVNQ